VAVRRLHVAADTIASRDATSTAILLRRAPTHHQSPESAMTTARRSRLQAAGSIFGGLPSDIGAPLASILR